MIETKIPDERAILIGIISKGQDESEVEEFLDELAFLAETAGAQTVKRFTQKVDVPNPRSTNATDSSKATSGMAKVAALTRATWLNVI